MTAAHATNPATRADPPQVDVIERAEMLLQDITALPWYAVISDHDEESSVVSEGERTEHRWGYGVAIGLRRCDARFIGEAPALITELVAALKAAREELEWHK
jgi:hypothetical protein